MLKNLKLTNNYNNKGLLSAKKNVKGKVIKCGPKKRNIAAKVVENFSRIEEDIKSTDVNLTSNSGEPINKEFSKLLDDCEIDWIQEELPSFEVTIAEDMPILDSIDLCEEAFGNMFDSNADEDLFKISHEISSSIPYGSLSKNIANISGTFEKVDSSLLFEDQSDITKHTLHITDLSSSEVRYEQENMLEPTLSPDISQSSNCFINEMVAKNSFTK
ncbi:hypothetical protein TBLA_0I03560 [Henningerozyma blattae CBS 6284]|uniref:Uncharacterized protein n=1 Tax=Henningerozyma blattae (strain ATCC 34711 / CBS 6284 / DSM 70876 / NBRC 10599 / NRRL Y-10934 / UCD 77-7) TaxID=1071380 RepID=I2H9F7_HENB6|nr:hypothetical protein TBLA_0I03560 [Tetrapisispora blattae CBS 6284]CCH63009.1 hypothetical protein TBLA_0I03560 [Tetrapisispora blattae CBS 6284]